MQSIVTELQLDTCIENLTKTPPVRTVIVQMPIEKTLAINAAFINSLISKGYQGVYVTLSMSYIEIINQFERLSIKTSQLQFIDGISNLYGFKELENTNVKYVRGPLALADIITCMRSSLGSLDATKKFIFLDSLTCLMLYNQADRLTEFVRTINKMLTQNALAFATILQDQRIKKKLESSLENETISIDLKEIS